MQDVVEQRSNPRSIALDDNGFPHVVLHVVSSCLRSAPSCGITRERMERSFVCLRGEMGANECEHEIHLHVKPGRYSKHPLSSIVGKPSATLLPLDGADILSRELVAMNKEESLIKVIVYRGCISGLEPKLSLVNAVMDSICSFNSAFVCCNASKLPVLCLPCGSPIYRWEGRISLAVFKHLFDCIWV